MTAIVLAIAQIILLGIDLQSPKVKKPPTTEEVRRLAGKGGGEWLGQAILLRYGAAAFPAYEAILTDPKSESDEIAGVLIALASVGEVKGRFLSLVVPYLSHKDDAVRWPAVLLMKQIGTPEEGAILIALLSDENQFVRYAAAEALAATGGRRELTAMDAWLKTGAAFRDAHKYLQHVKECRDALEKRLKTTPKNLRDD